MAYDPYDVISVVRDYLPAQYKDTSLPNIPNDVVRVAYDQMMHDLYTRRDLPNALKNRIVNLAYASTGAGGYFNQVQTFMTCLDRYGMHSTTPNAEYSGVTFITRPRLCLQSSNLRNNRLMTALDTLNPTSMAFAIRALLDTNFGHANGGRYEHLCKTSPLFDWCNPFLVPVCNALTGFSGAPDITLQTQTTNGGYHCEAQTFAIGSDNLQRGSYNLTLNFRDSQHGPIMALFFYWLEYMRCVTRGIMLAYGDDIDDQRLNYTVSIYRFLLDPSKKYITKWAKFTGCYPTSLTIGGMFNVNQGETFVSAATNFAVPFICNKVEYMDYAILMDFNTLVRRYCPAINATVRGVWDEHIPGPNGEQTANLMHPNLPIDPITNWRGLPYITTDKHGVRLEYRRVNNPVFPRLNGKNEKDDLIDQLLYIDMQQKLIRDSEGSFVAQTSLHTPEYKERSERYRGVDMKTFFNRVMASTETDSKSFESIPIGTINRSVGIDPEPNPHPTVEESAPPPTKTVEPSYPPIIIAPAILKNNSSEVYNSDVVEQARKAYNQQLVALGLDPLGAAAFKAKFKEQKQTSGIHVTISNLQELFLN